MVAASSSPVWNEQISFIEQFPPLAQRIRIQILDDAKTGDVILATHFLDLQQISDPTRNGNARPLAPTEMLGSRWFEGNDGVSAGFNPVFGPSWVNLYGSPQNSTLRDVHQVKPRHFR